MRGFFSCPACCPVRGLENLGAPGRLAGAKESIRTIDGAVDELLDKTGAREPAERNATEIGGREITDVEPQLGVSPAPHLCASAARLKRPDTVIVLHERVAKLQSDRPLRSVG